MSEYRDIALKDLDDALFALEHKRYRSAVFFFQQFAEKSAKALLQKKEPAHKHLKSHIVEFILEAYDDVHKASDLADKARYLTSFYYSTRYPGDNYSEITESQAQRAKMFAEILEEYFKAELEVLLNAANGITANHESLPKLNEIR